MEREGFPMGASARGNAAIVTLCQVFTGIVDARALGPEGVGPSAREGTAFGRRGGRLPGFWLGMAVGCPVGSKGL